MCVCLAFSFEETSWTSASGQVGKPLVSMNRGTKSDRICYPVGVTFTFRLIIFQDLVKWPLSPELLDRMGFNIFESGTPLYYWTLWYNSPLQPKAPVGTPGLMDIPRRIESLHRICLLSISPPVRNTLPSRVVMSE